MAGAARGDNLAVGRAGGSSVLGKTGGNMCI